MWAIKLWNKCAKKEKDPDLDSDEEDLIEHVETHLDTCGKHALVLAFALMQIATLGTAAVYYYSFMAAECNPIVYNISNPFEDEPFKSMGININYQFLLTVNCLTAIVCKFGSIVSLRLALEEYQNLNENRTYFVYAILMCLAPTSLLASIYTYDHDNCMPVNFLLPQQGA